MKYKHIIWDWNGTLLDDRWLCVDGINNGLMKRGLDPITEETYRNVFTFPVKSYYENLGFDFKKEPFEVAGDEFVNFYGQNFYRAKLHKSVRSVLDKIKHQNITQSILSAGKHEFLLGWVEDHKLTDYFTWIKGIDNQYATGKLDLGLSFIDELPYQNNDIIMVGDTMHDSEVADAMKIECVLVDHGHISRDRLQKTGRKVISNMGQVLDILTRKV